ncbi:hypothetical protein [Leifsonia poae]|uniref:DUF3137 domain-containing protein n=1 Tax=Leifsonia poae TaxID=110933 RepID=A0A9W6H704_9MICO|nr:hypothetical protein [Leifsonia poae]GLJ74726.1 hypothetical protein GCM10017584_02990 [Leifsonia poae]
MPETSPASVDLSALSSPVSKDEAAQFRSAARASGGRWPSPGMPFIVLIAWILAAIVVLGVLLPSLADANPVGAVVALLVAAAIVVGLITARIVTSRQRWATWLRLDRFARANGMVFTAQADAPAYPGSIFQVGTERILLNRLTTAAGNPGRFTDLATYRYVTGSGKSREVHTWGYLAIRLDHTLPHIVLDARSNNGLFGATNLPAEFSRSQRLSLEGDFDRYFTLYCPKDYERDALYLLTPDLMALLIDEAQDFDVEIVDDWMFVYSMQALELSSPGVARRMFRILSTVGAKATGRAERYGDDHAGSVAGVVVAPGGRRLRRAFPALGLVVAAVIALWWLVPLLWGQMQP